MTTTSENQAFHSHFVIRRQYSWPRKDKKFRRMIAKVGQEVKFLEFAIVQYAVNKTSDEARMLFMTPKLYRQKTRLN